MREYFWYKGNTNIPWRNKQGEKIMLKNPKKADLDKDGSLSSYEKKRGKAIERAMNKMMDGGMVKDERSKFMGGGIAYAGGGKAIKRGKK